MLSFELLLLVIGIGALFEVVRGHFVLARALNKRGAVADHHGGSELASVTVIRPIKGRDAGLEGNLRAALNYDYPGQVQTIFVLDDDRDPAYPPVVDAIRAAKRRGQDVALILAGEPPAGLTGKLHAMKKGLDKATGSVVAFADSDTRPSARLLAELVRALDAPQVGASFAPVVVSPPRTVGDVGYALMLNGLYGPFATKAAQPDGSLPFIMGQFMAFRRSTLDAIGGVEGTAGELVDDMSIGLRMAAAGYRNVMIDTPMTIIQEGLSLSEFSGVYRRWIMFSRTGLPASFKIPQHLRAALFFVLFAVGVGGLLVGSPWGAAIGALGVMAAGLSVNRLYDLYAGQPLQLWQRSLVFGLLFVSPIIYAQVLSGRSVSWRGRTYRLDKSGALAQKWRAEATPLRRTEFVPSDEFRVAGDLSGLVASGEFPR